MNSDIQNKLNSHHTVLRLGEANEPIWKDKKPKEFTKKMAELIVGVGELENLAAFHNADLGGVALDKNAAREVLIGSILAVSGPMCSYFSNQNDHTSLTKVNFPPSDLRNARDTALSQIGHMVLILLKPLTKLKPALDDDYGINAVSYAALETDLKDYDDSLGKPRLAVASRKSTTADLILRSAALDQIYDEHLDHLVTSFATTPEGAIFVSNWFNARKLINLGRSSSEPEDPTDPSPANPAEPHAVGLPIPTNPTAPATE